MLEEIINNKKSEFKALKKNTSYNEELFNIAEFSHNIFLERLKDVSKSGDNAIIAEIKRKSPSKGLLKKNLVPLLLSRIYQDSGAACVSVLTDEKYFNGSIQDLELVKQNISIPVLRKDFIIDEYQLLESKHHCADCILLIIACLTEDKFRNLLKTCSHLGLCALVEVHTIEEMELALKYNAKLIGINNRNLKTFEVDINTSKELAKIKTNDITLISESGLKDIGTLNSLKNVGIDAFLIGESLVTSPNPSRDLRELVKNVK